MFIAFFHDISSNVISWISFIHFLPLHVCAIVYFISLHFTSCHSLHPFHVCINLISLICSYVISFHFISFTPFTSCRFNCVIHCVHSVVHFIYALTSLHACHAYVRSFAYMTFLYLFRACVSTPFIHLLLLCCIDSCTTPKRLQLLWFCAVRLPN